MADLHVQPKRNWIWIILALIVIAIIFFLVKGCDNNDTVVAVPGTDTDTTIVVGTTEPDYSNVDMDAPQSKYDEITDMEISVQEKDNYTIYGLGDNILFPVDNSTIQPEASSRLEQIAASLNKRFKNATIGIYGRTDTTGSKTYNKELGMERATAVGEWLVNNGGIDRSRISIHSLGEVKPVVDNATSSAGMHANRSVQIVVFKQ